MKRYIDISIVGINADEGLKACSILENDLKNLDISYTINFTNNEKGTEFKIYNLFDEKDKIINLFTRNKKIITTYNNRYVLTSKNL